MWNSQAPLELLKSMPTHLTKENLEVIQKLIDVDKYKNSFQLHRDLCGEYAPFCTACDKSVMYPCAVAYVKMKQAEGLEVEITPEVVEELTIKQEEVVEQEAPAETIEETKQKKYVRIAVARIKK